MQLMNQTHSSPDETQIEAANHSPKGFILMWQVKRVTKKMSHPMTKTTQACPWTHMEMHAHALNLGRERLNN